jgi:Zn ribbon nucleic-acid-binding protein
MTDKIELKPCPCCGSDTLVLADAGSGFIVMCEKCGTKSGKQKSPEEAAKFWNERRAFIDIFPSDSIAFMVKFYKELGKILIENKKLKTALKIYEDAMWEGLAATGMQDSCWEIIDKAKERVEKLLRERK